MELTIEKMVKETTKVDLYLKEESGDICVMATGANGTSYYVVRFNSEGTLARVGCLPSDLGFKRVSGSRIALDSDLE